jgi:hypothetical protein
MTPPARDARRGRPQHAERFAARLEIAELIERRAGRATAARQAPESRRARIFECGCNRLVERSRNMMRHTLTQRAREILRRFADQIGLADAREK